MTLNSLELRHRTHLFGQHSFGFALFHRDLFFWSIVVHNMHDMELCMGGLGQKASLP